MKILLSEANLTNFTDLLKAIENELDKKNIPQFSGTETNKVRNWFLRKYVQAVKEDNIDLKSSIKPHQYKEGEPEWMNKPDIMDFNGQLPNNIVDEIGHIVDYFVTLEPNELRKIDREPYSTILQKVRDWDRELASASSDTKTEDVLKATLVRGTDYDIKMELPGGLKWVYLKTDESKKIEGDVMGHCVGRGGYKKADIYSLWDSKNRSHVTIEANDIQKQIKQIKGKGNKAPVEKYVPASIIFVAEKMIQGYKVLDDGENINMIRHELDYHFDDLNDLPEKYRDKPVFRNWVDVIYPTKIFPDQQKAIADVARRIKEV